MNLNGVVRIAPICQDRRFEGDLTNGSVPAPLIDALASFARPGSKIIEHVVPPGLTGKRGRCRVKEVGVNRADGVGLGSVQVITGSAQGRGHDVAKVKGVDADALARRFEVLREVFALLLDSFEAGSLLIVHFRSSPR